MSLVWMYYFPWSAGKHPRALVATAAVPRSHTMLLRAVTFEITGVLVCMSVPLGKVYGDALRHYRLPCPEDDAMKSAFKRAYGSVGAELPNFGAAESPPMPERVWWGKMIRATLSEVRVH